MTTTVRPARVDDFAQIQRIEVAACRAFTDVGYPSVADDPPFSDEELEEARAPGRLWVAVDDAAGDARPVGYVLAREISGRGHVEQVSVLPDRQGSGIGRLLIDQVAAWARERGLADLTLSTFREVPFNGPLYAHLGFRFMAEEELDDGLLAERAHEAAHGLDTDARAFMLRPL